MQAENLLNRLFDEAGFTGRAKAEECRSRFVKGGARLLRLHANRRDEFHLSRQHVAHQFGLTERQMRTLIEQWRTAGLITPVSEVPNGLSTYRFSDAVRTALKIVAPRLPSSIPPSPAPLPQDASVGVSLGVSAGHERRSVDVWQPQTSNQTSTIRETTFISADATMKVISQLDKGRLAKPNVPPERFQTSSDARPHFNEAERLAETRATRKPPTQPTNSGRTAHNLKKFDVAEIFTGLGRPVPVIGEDGDTYRAREEALAAWIANQARLKAAKAETQARAIKASAKAQRAVYTAKTAVNGPTPPTPNDADLARAQAEFEAKRADELERWDSEDPDYWREAAEPAQPEKIPADYDDGSCEKEAWRA